MNFIIKPIYGLLNVSDYSSGCGKDCSANCVGKCNRLGTCFSIW